MKKSNSRTFRFSDEVLKILVSYEGKNMNEQFEALVLDCFAKLPEAREKIKALNEQIKEKQSRLNELSQYIYKVELVKCDLDSVRQSVDFLVSRCSRLGGE